VIEAAHAVGALRVESGAAGRCASGNHPLHKRTT